MEALNHFVIDALRAMAAIDGLGGEIIASTRSTLPEREADRVQLAVWNLKSLLARAHREDPLGKLHALDERLQAAQEHSA